MNDRIDVPPDALFDELYERYGRPLEPEHRGQYLAVTPQGQTVIADSLAEAAGRAAAEFGRGSLLFKIGEGTAGNWR